MGGSWIVSDDMSSDMPATCFCSFSGRSAAGCGQFLGPDWVGRLADLHMALELSVAQGVSRQRHHFYWTWAYTLAYLIAQYYYLVLFVTFLYSFLILSIFYTHMLGSLESG